MKIIVFLMILILLFSSCSNVAVETTKSTTNKVEITVTSTTVANPDDNKDDVDDKLDDQPTDNDSTDSKVKIDINEYLVNLSNSEYCNDVDFLKFVSTMDGRTVGKTISA